MKMPTDARNRRIRELLTPEGVPISLQQADAGERIGGVAIDFVIIFAVILVLSFLAGLAAPDGPAEENLGLSFVLLVSFLLRNFYFVFFELRWQGQTPGKRVMKTRVIDARGGALGADAIVARNLVRDVELFLPLTVALAPDLVWPGAPWWAKVGAGLWAVIVMFLPLFNKDRARIGDLVAGTRVVAVPTIVLLPDLAADRMMIKPGRRRDAPPAFTPEQLDIYGAYELQVLADVLRGEGPNQLQTATTVCASIRRKIGWKGAEPFDPTTWLEEFYTALRAHMERKMLFGKKKADKYARD